MENQNMLYIWCLEQAQARFMNTLPKEQFDQLEELEFPWAYYEEELDKLGFHWEKKNPNGTRWAETIKEN